MTLPFAGAGRFFIVLSVRRSVIALSLSVGRRVRIVSVYIAAFCVLSMSCPVLDSQWIVTKNQPDKCGH